jgi:hypothetical protein
MAKLGINTGSSPNDGTGDSLLQGAIKINSNFNEIYNAIGNGTTITNSIGFARTAGISTVSGYATTAGISTFAVTAGVSSYSNISGLSTTSTYAITAGIATVALFAGNFSSVPDITVGVVTATSYNGSGANLTGIVTNILAGSNVSIARTGGNVTINSTAQSAVSTQWTTVASGIVTSSNVGIGTIAAISALHLNNGTLTVTGQSSKIQLNDGVRINLGSGGQTDASIYYDAVDLRIDTSSSIRIGNGNNNVFTAVAGEGSILYYNGSKKLQTLANGVAIFGDIGVTGITTTTNLRASGVITATNYYGNGSTLSNVVTSLVAGSNISISTSFGAVTLTANTDSVWNRTNTGIHTLGNVAIGTTIATSPLTVSGNSTFNGYINVSGGSVLAGVTTISSGRIEFGASDNIRIGNLNMGSGATRNISIGDQSLFNLSSGLGHNIALGEFTLYDTTSGQFNIALGDRAGQKITTGNYNVILGNYDGNSGNLDVRTVSNRVIIADGQGNIRQYIDQNGNVGIKTTLVTEALTVAGIVSATGFHGTLNAGQLTGTLPAIDGSALLNVVGSGSGVIVQDDNSPIGTAGTINFGSNLSVSFASGIATVTGSGIATYSAVAGIATYSTSSGVSTSSNYSNLSGISTYSITSGVSTYSNSSGISSSLTSTANINTSGIITASSFSGSGSALTNLPSGQLTGALPAIDGSALLNVTASGTGVVVKDNTVNVGSATTIDFGTGLDVTFSAGIATVTASGGSLQSRTTVSGVTTSITNNGIGNTNITGFKSYALMKVGLSTAGWLRLYTDSTSRENDANRSVGTDPIPGSGVIAEVITTGISTTQIVSPFVMGGNLDNPVDTTIYASIKNLSGTTQSITATLTILQLEA